jgi:sugar phosphate permease
LSNAGAWRFGFWTAGLLGVVWCVSFYPWFRDSPSQKKSVNQRELDLIRQGRAPEDVSHAIDRKVWIQLFSCRSLWAISLYYVFGGMGWSFFLSWVSRYFQEVQKIPYEKSEFQSGLPLFCGGIACLVGGTLSDWFVRRTGRRRLFRGLFAVSGQLTAAAAMLGLSFARNEVEAVVLLCVAAVGFDFGQGANWATIVDIGGRFAGTATGFINMIGNFGASLGPVIGALIFKNFGWPALFVTYTAFFLIAASMWLFIHPERKFYDERLQAEEAHLMDELL